MDDDRFNNGIGQLGPIAEKLQTLVIDEQYTEDLQNKLAASPPRPPIDAWSFSMGKAQAIDSMYRAIEETMYHLAPSYEEAGMMRPEWGLIVGFKDSLYTRFRAILKQLTAASE